METYYHQVIERIRRLTPLRHDGKSRYWPENATQLGNRVARATPLLKARGCTVERRHSGTRTVMIIPPRAG
jgi:hypothetical protein